MTDVLYNRPHDHRVWRYGEEWYIFDRSGETPFDCDDGPTILDRDEATVWLDGDTMTVNVLGRDITAEVTSFREVSWEDAGIGLAPTSPAGL